jgi:hypothetical protein
MFAVFAGAGLGWAVAVVAGLLLLAWHRHRHSGWGTWQKESPAKPAGRERHIYGFLA